MRGGFEGCSRELVSYGLYVAFCGYGEQLNHNDADESNIVNDPRAIAGSVENTVCWLIREAAKGRMSTLR